MSKETPPNKGTKKPPTSQSETPEVYKNRVNINLSFVAALCVIVLVAILLVTIGYVVYWNDVNRKYDITRPGQNTDMQNSPEDDEDEDIDTTSRVDAPAAKQKIDFLNKEIRALDATNQFNPEDLSDQNLQLTPSDQPSL